MTAASASGAEGLRRLYDSLARYHWLRRRLRRCPAGEGLELHKRLGPPPAGSCGPGAGAAALHGWLRELLALPAGARVLDAGCGFGATVFALARAGPGAFVGIAPSEYQIRRARAQGAALGLQERCSFRVQGYEAPVAGTFDAVVAVESLGHAADLAQALANLAACTALRGRLVAVDDAAIDGGVERSAEGNELRARWSTPHLHSVAGWRAALVAAGWRTTAEHDLTAQVRPRPEPVLARAERRLRRARALWPGAGGRAVVDAYLGGIALERLYARGAMRYLAFVAERQR